MSCSSESKGFKSSDDPKVIQLGLNISVIGNSASDVEVYVNDRKEACGQLSVANLEHVTDQDGASHSGLGGEVLKRPVLDKVVDLKDMDSEHKEHEKYSSSTASDEPKDKIMSKGDDLTIVDEIKSAMGNFEKFSEHLKEIPRLSTKRIYTSTPYPDKTNSRSEGNLSCLQHPPRPFIRKHDFRDRKYFRKPKPLPGDIFLKPLPAEDYFKKTYVRRYYDIESYHHYSSVDNLPQYYENDGDIRATGKYLAKSDVDKSDGFSSNSDVCVTDIKNSKKGGSDVNDKQSTSSESTKDIKIYQSGGIIIMQNFSENTDVIEKKNRLIEHCNKLTGKIETNLPSSDDSQRLLLNSSSDEVKGKFVQFDLSSGNAKRKSSPPSSEIPEHDYAKNLGNLLTTHPNQDLTSLSTQENDSMISNLLGMSPTSSTSGKKLEWDSGADVGYLNMDLTTENISTIERIILKGLTNDGTSEKQVIYERTGEETGSRQTKFILERLPSELEMKGVSNKNLTPEKNESDQNISVNTKSSSGTSKSDKGPSCIPKKRQNMDAKNESREKFQSPVKNRTNKTKYYPKIKKSEEDYTENKKSEADAFLESEKHTDASWAVKSSNGKQDLAHSECLVQGEPNPNYVDKCTYVNTLFPEPCFELPLDNISKSEESGRSDSSDRYNINQAESPRIKKLKKKRNSIQESNLTSRLKDKIDTIIDIARHSRAESSGRPNSETPESSDKIKLLRKFEELECGDKKSVQPMVVKSDPTSLVSVHKSTNLNSKEKFARSRPVPTSSGSTRSDKLNSDSTRDSAVVLDNIKSFSDQIVQTSELRCESKAIQAFQSAKCSAESSQIDEKSARKSDEIPTGDNAVNGVDSSNLLSFCSKSIQAPGMNSSLPKHLAHPKHIYLSEHLNTKSTQFFGGSGTSLPNYHVSAVGKETKKEKILKNKLLPGDENSRIQIENVKNAWRNENSKKELMIENVDRVNNSKADECSGKSTTKIIGGIKKGQNDSEDKENFSLNEEELTDNSKRHSSRSRVESRESYNPVNGSKKSDSLNFGSCEVQLSDDGRNVVLTSERLKEHGDTIDRNIIQEKYFQSQLLELGARHMISRGTSIEKKRDAEKNIQTSFSLRAGVSVSCQYSPTHMSRGEDVQRYPQVGNELKEEIQAENLEKKGEKCEARTKKIDENSFNTLESSPGEPIYTTVDTLSSSGRSVHSWIPGEQKSFENRVTVDRALSFEYLPGHIYENVENLARESPKETERNLNLELNEINSTPTSGGQVKESESGHTIVLENSSARGSDQLKNLDTNLTELEMVVNRLHEKEALFQRITDSVLTSVSRVRGSGDSTFPSVNGKDLSNNTSQGAEEIKSEFVAPEESGKLNGSKPGTSEKYICTKDVSTACQTEDINNDPDHFREERKKLELKMNDEKEQQIKWIENEINHLNMLRSLLEKQDDLSSTNRKKRHYYLTETKEGSIPSTAEILGQETFKNILAISLPRSLPSISQDQSETKISPPLKLPDDSVSESKEVPNNVKHFAQFGMALSLTRANAMREVTMLPVGIQVTLRGKKSGSRDGTLQGKKSDSADSKNRRSQNHSSQDIGQSDVGVQHPSVGNRLTGSSSTFESADSLRRCRCFKCEKSNCACSSESTERRKSLQNSLKKSSMHKEDSGEVFGQSSTIVSGESSKLDVKIPEIRDMDDSRGVSTIGTPSPEIRSRESSKQEHSRISSEGSTPFGKCVCSCHAKPLPRCQSCNLLNTCKKCKCYKRITCCICKIRPSESSPRRKCATISSTCFYKKDCCQMCQCSRKKSELCSRCPCHVTSEKPQSKCKKYEERSCQTEGGKCTCCECDEKGKQDSGLYRETKYMTEEQHSSENRKSSDVVYLSEQKYEQERKASIEEKFPYQMKVPIEKKAPAEVKNAGQRKNEIESRTPSQLHALEIKELKKKAQCRCRSSDARRKSSEDHPRHYFLQVEDTTEEESSESCDNRNSLEVITIKVPIRKVFKGNRNASSPQRNSYQKKSVQGNDLYVGDTRYVDENIRDGMECNCFEKCELRSYKHYVERPRLRGDGCVCRTQLGDAQRQVMYDEPRMCKCCEDCRGNMKSEERSYEEYALRDDYKRQKSNVVPYEIPTKDENLCNCVHCMQENNYKPLVYSPKQHGYEEEEILYSAECHCCSDCSGKMRDEGDVELKSSELPKPDIFSGYGGGYEGENLSEATDFSFGTKIREKSPTDQANLTDMTDEKHEKSSKGKSKTTTSSKESSPKLSRKSPRRMKSCRTHASPKSKSGKGGTRDGNRNNNADYYNFNKKEYLTKSELEREGKKKAPTRLSLQECLTVKRPDVYTRAECRRKIISEKTRDRVERHNKRMECLTKLMPQCDVPGKHGELKLFTSAQMRKQTRKHYKNLPEVTNKVAEEKKKIQFRTNKLMAEIFAKKLQLQTLKGRLNLSNSFTVMSTM